MISFVSIFFETQKGFRCLDLAPFLRSEPALRVGTLCTCIGGGRQRIEKAEIQSISETLKEIACLEGSSFEEVQRFGFGSWTQIQFWPWESLVWVLISADYGLNHLMKIRLS